MKTRSCILILFLWIALLAIGGCASSEGPPLLIISSDRYDDVFDAALEAVHRVRLQPVLVDRRAGIIETDSRTAGSFLEPWEGNNASFEQAMENTLHHQRRRVRFEFLPGRRTLPQPRTDQPLPDPGEAPFAEEMIDLTTYEGDIHVHASVIVERQYRPGLRRNSWSRRLTTQMRYVDTDDGDQPLPPSFWIPVDRDIPFERRLLARVEALEQREEDETTDAHR